MFKKIFYLIIICSLLFSVSTSVMAQESEPVEEKQTAAEIFTEALNDYNAENYALAEEKFSSLLESNELDEGLEFSVLYYSTMTAVNRYQTAKAIDYLEKMNDLGFQSGNLNWQIAELLLKK